MELSIPTSMKANTRANSISIVPYSAELDATLLELEKRSPQGKLISLEMIRKHFLSRAIAFDRFEAFVAIDEHNCAIGAAIGSIVPIEIGNTTVDAGFVFDVRVDPGARNQKVGRRLADHVVRHYFLKHGVAFHFVTLKRSNVPVIKLAQHVSDKIHFTEFVYLTIPTGRRLMSPPHRDGTSRFKIILSGNSARQNCGFVSQGELGVWLLDQSYQLKVRNIHPIVNFLSKALTWSEMSKNVKFPRTGDTLRMAALYNHSTENLGYLNDVLCRLENDGVDYLLVCCQKGDGVWKALKGLSINAYGYYLMSNVEIGANEHVALDVRCL